MNTDMDTAFSSRGRRFEVMRVSFYWGRMRFNWQSEVFRNVSHLYIYLQPQKAERND